MALCVHLTRILLPAQIFFLRRRSRLAVFAFAAVVFVPRFGPLLYNVFIILAGCTRKQFGISSLLGAWRGFVGPFLINASAQPASARASSFLGRKKSSVLDGPGSRFP